jgi:ketosteroid isomerase-like protein
VSSLTSSFVAAWNASDATAYGAMIADDVVHMPQGAVANIGRDAVLAAMAEQFDVTTVQQSATIDEVVVMGDYANAYGTWRVDPVSAADEAAEVTAGRWMVLYRRNAEGGWQFWRWMWNQTTGAAPTPAA